MLRRYSYYNYLIIAIDFINFIFFGLLNYNIRLYSLLLLYIVYFLDSIIFRPYCSKMNVLYLLIKLVSIYTIYFSFSNFRNYKNFNDKFLNLWLNIRFPNFCTIMFIISYIYIFKKRRFFNIASFTRNDYIFRGSN